MVDRLRRLARRALRRRARRRRPSSAAAATSRSTPPPGPTCTRAERGMPFLRVNGTALYYTRTGPVRRSRAAALAPRLRDQLASLGAGPAALRRRTTTASPSTTAPRAAPAPPGGPSRSPRWPPTRWGCSTRSASSPRTSTASPTAAWWPRRWPSASRTGCAVSSSAAPRPVVRGRRCRRPADLVRPRAQHAHSGTGRYGLSAALFSEQFTREHPDEARELTANLQRHRAPYSGVAAHLLASVYHDTVSRLRLIRSPTLVVHGGADRMTPLRNADAAGRGHPRRRAGGDPGHRARLPAGEAGGVRAPWCSTSCAVATPGPGRPRRNPTEPLTPGLGAAGGRAAHRPQPRACAPGGRPERAQRVTTYGPRPIENGRGRSHVAADGRAGRPARPGARHRDGEDPRAGPRGARLLRLPGGPVRRARRREAARPGGADRVRRRRARASSTPASSPRSWRASPERSR